MLTQISHSSPLWRVNVVAVAIAFYNVTVFIKQVDAPIVPGSKIMRVRDVLDPKSGELIKSLMTLKIERETKLVSDEHKFHSSQDEGAFAGVGVKGRDVDGAV